MTRFSPVCDRDLVINLQSTLIDHGHLPNGGPLCVQASTHALCKSSGLHAKGIHQLLVTFLARLIARLVTHLGAQMRNYELPTWSFRLFLPTLYLRTRLEEYMNLV